MSNLKWKPILAHAANIVESYSTGVTLRQLFYRLVADGTLPNTQPHYRRLSAITAEARRAGEFPDLIDRTSRIERPISFTGPDHAAEWLRNLYRKDRTTGQEHSIYLGVEKAGISEQLNAWFTQPLGIPHIALGGFSSQTLCDQVAYDIGKQDRRAILIYAGDFDPSGATIGEDFARRVMFFRSTHRIALNPEQIKEHNLAHNSDPTVTAKLRRDPRAAGFIARYGSLVQYEVDALPPDTLRDLYQNAIDKYWDPDAYEAVMAEEEAERAELAKPRS